jgi:uncharacterized HhH-GPD family protein
MLTQRGIAFRAVDGQAAATALLEFSGSPRVPRASARRCLAWAGFPAEHARFLESNANAMMVGLLFDRMIDANEAWMAPLRLARRLGHLDMSAIARMPVQALENAIRGGPGEKALHRFPGQQARSVKACAEKLIALYAGRAENIWAGVPDALVVRSRLLEFRGVSQKLANMMTRVLCTSYAVPLIRWSRIDVAVDRHVARVFLRTGMVAGEPGRKCYAVPELREAVIAAARRLHPDFPGALDEPAFWIGKDWCNASNAFCRDGATPCPLLAACPRRRVSWEVVEPGRTAAHRSNERRAPS